MSNDPSILSERERDVLRLVATGATNQQIADRLDISANTVKVHLRNIFSKTGATSRTEVTMYAVRAGLVSIAPGTVEVAGLPAPLELPPVAVVPIPAEPLEQPASQELLPPVVPAPAPTVTIGGHLLSRRIVGMLGVLVGVVLAVASIALVQGLRGATPSLHPSPTDPANTAAPPGGNWGAGKAPGQALIGAAAVKYNGPILVIGGADSERVLNSVYRYDPLKDTWTQLNPKLTPVRDVQAVVLSGKIYVPGGRTADGGITNVLEIFDPRSGEWSRGSSLPAPRSAYGLAEVEGSMYLFGGWDGKNYRAEVYRYDPDSGSWQEQTLMPTARAYPGVATFEGNVYVIGGENSTGLLYTNEVYIPANEGGAEAQPWRTRPPLLQPRSRSGTSSFENKIYLFGGSDNADTPLLYDVRDDKWYPLVAPAAAIGAQPAVVYRDGLFYITGGGSDQAPSDRLLVFRAGYSISVPVQP